MALRTAQRCRRGRPAAKHLRSTVLAIISLAAAALAPFRPTSAFSALASTVATNDANVKDTRRGFPDVSRFGQGSRRKGQQSRQKWRKAHKVRDEAYMAKVNITHVGQYLPGRVLHVNTTASGAAFLNVGRGRPCMLLPQDWDGPVEQGQYLHTWAKQIVWEDGHVLLTMIKPRREVSSLESGESLSGTVTHVDTRFGGIFVDVGATKDGMLLQGQLTEEFNSSLTEPIAPGFKLDVWVKDIRPDGTFSLTTFRPKKPMEELNVGQKCQGRVRKLPSFGGAFIDLGYEKDGWLPDHELSAGVLPEAPEIGQQVDVWVKELTKEKGLQLTLQEPRKSLDTLRVGKRLRGTITGMTSFGGIFVDVGAVRDGLVHNADAGTGSETLEVGQEVDVWVKQRKGEWSLQLTMVEPQAVEGDLKIGQQVRGRVTGVNRLGGLFVDIGLVNDALVRWEELTQEVQDGPPAEVLPVGEVLDLWIKAVHRDGKVDLTMKHEAEKPHGQAEQVPFRRGIV